GPPALLLGHLVTTWATRSSSCRHVHVYILTFSVGFPANAFTLAVLVAKSRRRRPAAPSGHRRPLLATLTAADLLLLLNLTAADLLLLLFLPFKMAEAAAGMVWPLPAALCPVANFCFYGSTYL
ncbi:FFAR3 protein, partial [Buphagus erythrorhynchus]|nr:FFAR3 protein [Buphagus erythrorhynchus]